MRHLDSTTLKPFANFSAEFAPLLAKTTILKPSKRRESEEGETPKCDRVDLFHAVATGRRGRRRQPEKETLVTLWSLTFLTLTPFARFQNWRISWEGSKFCGKVGKRIESGAIEVPRVREGCTAKTKVKLLAERGAFFVNWAVGAPLLSGRPPSPPAPTLPTKRTIHKKLTPLR